MERKEIFILAAVCLAVCILIGCINTFRDAGTEDATNPPADSESQSTEAAVTTDYWDYLHAQTTTEPVQTDENGNPIPAETDENGNPIPAVTDENNEPNPAETNENGEPTVTDNAPATTDEQPAETDATGIFSSTFSGTAGSTATTATTATTVSTTPFVIHITG